MPSLHNKSAWLEVYNRGVVFYQKKKTATSMISFFRAHKRLSIIFVLWAVLCSLILLPNWREGPFYLLFFSTLFLMLIASQVFWIDRIHPGSIKTPCCDSVGQETRTNLGIGRITLQNRSLSAEAGFCALHLTLSMGSYSLRLVVVISPLHSLTEVFARPYTRIPGCILPASLGAFSYANSVCWRSAAAR